MSVDDYFCRPLWAGGSLEATFIYLFIFQILISLYEEKQDEQHICMIALKMQFSPFDMIIYTYVHIYRFYISISSLRCYC